MREGRKYSRKSTEKGTLIWDPHHLEAEVGSVIQVINPETKEAKYFRFVSNPNEKRSGQAGKTSLLGKGAFSRVKFAIAVEPLENSSKENHEFIELKNESQNLYVVRISNLQKIQQDRIRAGNKLFPSPVFSARLGDKEYTIMPYLGESLEIISQKCKEKIKNTEEKSQSPSKTIDLFNLKQFLQLGLAISKEIADFHKKGYQHKDISYKNLVISKKNDQFIAKLIDYDLAAPIESKHSTPLQKWYDGEDTLTVLKNFYDILPKEIRDHNGAIDQIINTARKDIQNSTTLVELHTTALSEVEQLLEGQAIDETQGVLYSSISNPPILQKNIEPGADTKDSPAIQNIGSSNNNEINLVSENRNPYRALRDEKSSNPNLTPPQNNDAASSALVAGMYGRSTASFQFKIMNNNSAAYSFGPRVDSPASS